MAEVSSSTSLPVSADKVWDMIGQFGGLADWHPAVEACTLEDGGRLRRLTLPGGAEIVESLEKQDDEGRSYVYRIVSSPLPVENYEATLRVEPDGDDGCKIHWSGNFDPVGEVEKASKIVEGIYTSGFDALKKAWGI